MNIETLRAVETLRAAILGTRPDTSRKGRAFQVTFYKANGERRVMRARLGMVRGITGKGLSFNPSEHGLVNVWELGNGYRMVPLARVVSLRVPDRSKHLKEVIKGAVVRHALGGNVSSVSAW